MIATEYYEEPVAATQTADRSAITIVGSIVGTRTDPREVLELHGAGKTKVIRETRRLDQVNEANAEPEAGRIIARSSRSPTSPSTERTSNLPVRIVADSYR